MQIVPRATNLLQADEKEAMTDDEVKEWEKKIKDSLLRKRFNAWQCIYSYEDDYVIINQH